MQIYQCSAKFDLVFEVELRQLRSAGVIWLVEKSFHISSLLLCNF